MSLAKVQQWLASRRAAKRGKGKGRLSGGHSAPAVAAGPVPEIRRQRRASEDQETLRSRGSTVGSPTPISISASSSYDPIQLLSFATSPGARRRSLAQYSQQSSQQSDVTITTTMSSRSRAQTHSGAGDGESVVRRVMLKLSPSMRRRREQKRGKSPSRSPSDLHGRRPEDTESTASDIWKVGEVRGGIALLSGGDQLKLPESVLEGELKKEGFLQKHGRRFGGWKRRWCVLNVGEVAVFKSESMVGFSGVIVLDQIVAVHYPSSVPSFGFTFEVVTNKRSFVMASRTEEEAIHWVHLLRRASHTDKPKSVKVSSSRFFVKPVADFTGPRTEEELQSGLEKYQNVAEEEEGYNALRHHIDEIETEKQEPAEEEASGASGEMPKEAEPSLDMAKEGLAIDALKGFLNCN